MSKKCLTFSLFFVFCTGLLVALPFSSARAGGHRSGTECVDYWTDACTVLERGRVRPPKHFPGRLVCFPYHKRAGGQVAFFGLPDFNPNTPLPARIAQLDAATLKDSKVTGPDGQFCRSYHLLVQRGVQVVVICDDLGMGWVGPHDFGVAMQTGRAPRVIPVGAF